MADLPRLHREAVYGRPGWRVADTGLVLIRRRKDGAWLLALRNKACRRWAAEVQLRGATFPSRAEALRIVGAMLQIAPIGEVIPARLIKQPSGQWHSADGHFRVIRTGGAGRPGWTMQAISDAARGHCRARHHPQSRDLPSDMTLREVARNLSRWRRHELRFEP
jgi:hypothetical protein